MRRMWLPAMVVMLTAIVAIACWANVIGHKRDDGDSSKAERIILPPERQDPLDRVLRDAQVMPPRWYRGLTIFPIQLSDERSDFRPLTFDEAIERGSLTVREIGRGRVNAVEVRNRGERPVFILSGEIMTGSKQDRIASADTLVPPRSGWITLDVYCVEHGRWHKVSDKFGTKRSLVNAGIRQVAQAAAPQTEVWDQVAAKAGAVGVMQSESGAFNEIYNAEPIQDKLADYRKKLGSAITSRTTGVAAVTNGRIIAVDIFTNPELLHSLWRKLLDSYALDALERPDSDADEKLTRRDIEELLRWAESDRAPRRERHTPGIGSLFSLRSRRAEGFVLTYHDKVIHANFFEARPLILKPASGRLLLPQTR